MRCTQYSDLITLHWVDPKREGEEQDVIFLHERKVKGGREGGREGGRAWYSHFGDHPELRKETVMD